jgi:hypothetical protein
LASTYETTQRRNPKQQQDHTNRRESLKYQIKQILI